jgi:hypothetical protein
VDEARRAALRDQAIGANASGTAVPLDPGELIALLNSHAAAVELADAVAAFQTIDAVDPGGAGNATASEIRNRFRRRVEERTLRVNTALAKFRLATEDTR